MIRLLEIDFRMFFNEEFLMEKIFFYFVANCREDEINRRTGL